MLAPDTTPPEAVEAPQTLQRARGRVELVMGARDGIPRLERLFQQGCAKAMLPRTGAAVPEAVLLNTSGGVTGGDLIEYRVCAGSGARLAATTQAAERVYRALAGTARIETKLKAGIGAHLEWLPRETIVFDGGRFARRIEADLAGNARLTALETLVLGRAASGERLSRGAISDCWSVRRDGRLIHMEAVRAAGDLARAASCLATFGGRRALATLIHAGPDAEDRLDGTRAALAEAGVAGVVAAASAKPGVLIVRWLAADLAPLRTALARYLVLFRGCPPPRVWSL